MEKVSIIIPVYNAEQYLKKALDDVLAQTYSNIEIICVDDGSTDSSLSILNEYKAKDERIRVYKQTQPSDGAAFARNLGLEKATGEYLLFLDADDMFEPTLVEESVNRALETNADIVMFDAYIYDSERNADVYTSRIVHYGYLPQTDEFVPKDYPLKLFQMYAGAPWNHLFKADLIKSNNIVFHPVHITDDLGFVHIAYACAEKVSILRKRLVRYRRDAVGNQTSTYSKWPESGYTPYVFIKEKLKQLGLYEYYKVTFVRDFLDHADFFMNQMDCFETFSKLYYALKNRYFKEFNVFDVDKNDLEPRHVKMIDLISHLNANDYLVKKNNASYYNDHKFSTKVDWNDGKIKKIVIYGAGVFGRMIYSDFLEEDNIKVVHWVDKNYKKLGGCIESPDVIKNEEIDMVFVAIYDSEIYEVVKKYLLSIKIDEEKIVWMEQTYKG